MYGLKFGMITLTGLEPHPQDAKRSGYARVELAAMPTSEAPAKESVALTETSREAAPYRATRGRNGHASTLRRGRRGPQ